jgi:hypothetical protein
MKNFVFTGCGGFHGLQGPIQCVRSATTIDDPFVIFDPETRRYDHKMTTPGILIMAVDNLPTEMPREASDHFSVSLMPYVEKLVRLSLPFFFFFFFFLEVKISEGREMLMMRGVFFFGVGCRSSASLRIRQ